MKIVDWRGEVEVDFRHSLHSIDLWQASLKVWYAYDSFLKNSLRMPRPGENETILNVQER